MFCAANLGQSTIASVQGGSVNSRRKPPFKWLTGDDGFVPKSANHVFAMA
jgi:hypothetical protein